MGVGSFSGPAHVRKAQIPSEQDADPRERDESPQVRHSETHILPVVAGQFGSIATLPKIEVGKKEPGVTRMVIFQWGLMSTSRCTPQEKSGAPLSESLSKRGALEVRQGDTGGDTGHGSGPTVGPKTGFCGSQGI